MRVGWELILVPLIAMVVAVLASIFRGAEEARRRQNQRPGGEPRRERSRSDGSGIDQFLEEIRRRQAARQTQREMRRPPIEPGPEAAVEERPMPGGGDLSSTWGTAGRAIASSPRRNSGMRAMTSRDRLTFSASLALMHSQE